MHQHSNYRSPRRRREKKGYEKIFEDIRVEYFPNMEKEIVNQVQEAQRVPYRINPRRNTPKHILIKLTKTKPVHPKGNQFWMFIGRTDAEAETPTLWPPDAKNGLIWKDPYVGKDWRQEEKGTTEDEMVGWHHRLNGHEFEQAPGVGDGQGSLACCVQSMELQSGTQLSNWTELM